MKNKKNLKTLPKFRNEAEEHEFWQTHDSTDYVDYSPANRVTIEFDPGVEQPVKLISIRLPRDLLNKLKVLAAKRDVPYQSLIKMILAERLEDRTEAQNSS
jgi:predicted DNA binding CopG/RHH family protein